VTSIDERQTEVAPETAPAPPSRRSTVVRLVAAAAVWAVTSALACLQLFRGGTAGLADNGDATRLMCRLGLQIGPGSSQPTFEAHYLPVDVCPAGGFFEYRTSWRFVVHVTLWLYRHVTGETVFDIAALGVVCALLLGAGAAALFLALPGRTGGRALLVGLMVVAACDIGFVTYFNSGYSDPAGLVGLPFLLAGLVGLVTRRTWPWLLVTMASLAFLSTAKTQLAPAVGVALVVLLLTRTHWAHRPAAGRWRIPRPTLTVGLLLLAVTAVAGFFAKGQGASFSRGNKFNMLFYTLLPDSPDPAADLREMGLPTSLARFSGTGAWEVYTPYNDPDVLAHADRIYSWSTYAHFLLHHPDRLWGMACRSFDAVLGARVEYLGNLPGVPGPDTGPQLADRPSPVFGLFGHLPAGWPVPVLLLLWLVAAGVGLWWVRRGSLDRVARGVLMLALAGWALSQALVALLDGYYELAKHDVHAAFATGLLLAVLLESLGRYAVPGVWRRARRGRATAEPAPAPVTV
jgi:hypothetical protein